MGQVWIGSCNPRQVSRIDNKVVDWFGRWNNVSCRQNVAVVDEVMVGGATQSHLDGKWNRGLNRIGSCHPRQVSRMDKRLVERNVRRRLALDRRSG